MLLPTSCGSATLPFFFLLHSSQFWGPVQSGSSKKTYGDPGDVKDSPRLKFTSCLPAASITEASEAHHEVRRDLKGRPCRSWLRIIWERCQCPWSIGEAQGVLLLLHPCTCPSPPFWTHPRWLWSSQDLWRTRSESAKGYHLRVFWARWRNLSWRIKEMTINSMCTRSGSHLSSGCIELAKICTSAASILRQWIKYYISLH